MKRRIAAAAAFAFLAFPSAALAADATIQAVDGNATDGSDNRWTPNVVDVKVGEKVTWTFAGTELSHNVKGSATSTLASSPAVGGPDVS